MRTRTQRGDPMAPVLFPFKKTLLVLMCIGLLPLAQEVSSANPQTVSLPAIQQGSSAVETAIKETEVVKTTAEKSSVDRAKLFGLTKEEWGRYEEIMSGPTGLRSPKIDPILALGLHARTDVERKHYAELAVQNEHQWVAALFTFQRAYDEVQTRRYGHLPILPSLDQVSKNPLTSLKGDVKAGDRILFFGRALPCEACDARLQKLLALLKQKESKVGLDIYLMDTGLVDTVVQNWARDRGISSQMIQRKIITLNHEQGELIKLDGTRLPPTAILRRGNDYFGLDNL